MEKAPADLELVLSYFAGFSPLQLRQLTALGDLYREWNEKINVISRKDIGSLYEKHILHSLAIAAAFTWPAGAEILDIGTGGGFPGIPLAIFFPDQHFHLVDSIGKKIKVVEAVRDAIGLQNVSTQHGRAEEIKNRKFDCVVSRAVAPLKDLWAWSRGLLLQGTPHPPPPTPPSTSTPFAKSDRPAIILIKCHPHTASPFHRQHHGSAGLRPPHSARSHLPQRWRPRRRDLRQRMPPPPHGDPRDIQHRLLPRKIPALRARPLIEVFPVDPPLPNPLSQLAACSSHLPSPMPLPANHRSHQPAYPTEP
jgi:16S rRNA (guanine527-N7)-methyltransferase